MGKQSFIRRYRSKISVALDYERLLADSGIEIEERLIPLSEFARFYAPWNQKNGKINTTIEEVLPDPDYRTIRFADMGEYSVSNQETIHEHPLAVELWPIPLARDTELNKTLVLDSNKTIYTLLKKYGPSPSLKLAVIELAGPDLEKLVPDFIVLKRSP